MADTKISGMAAAAALTGAEVLPVVQSAANVKATTQQVVDAAMTTGLTRQALGSINTNTTIDWSAGSYATATIAGALAFTFSDPAPTGKACVAYLQLTNGGSAAITWPVSVTWSGGTAPTLHASGVDLLRFYTQDNGTTWFGTAENDESNVAGSDTQVLFNDGGTASGDSGLTYNKTTDTLTCKVYQAQRANNAPIIQTGTTSSDACIIWVTGNELQAARGDIGDLISFQASIVKASAQFQSGSYAMGVYNSGLAFGNTNFSAFANATCHSVFVCGATGGYDTALTRDAAGTLAQRDGTNAQTFRVYNTYTDASNYERLSLNAGASGDWFQIAAETAGTGVDNIGLALTPAGTGAISAHVPDSTATGGNARGANAVDLQTGRDGASQVASGNNAAILGGFKNTASGTRSGVLSGNTNVASGTESGVLCGRLNTSSANYSLAAGEGCTSSNTATVAFGRYNTASGIYSWVPGGNQATTRGIQAARAFASVQRAALGDSQVFGLVCRITTTSTAATLLTSRDATTNGLDICVLPNNSSAHFRARVCARNATSVGSGSWEICGTIERGANAASTSLVGSTTIRTFGVSASLGSPTVDVIANTTHGAAVIQVTAANSDTTYWVGDIELVQVA